MGLGQDILAAIGKIYILWMELGFSGVCLRLKVDLPLICCVIASGVDRLPIWVVGKTCMSQALCNISVKAVGIRWKWNKKAWMDQTIMKEWLLIFYSHIGTRSVVLAMDNFPAHLTGLELARPPSNSYTHLLAAKEFNQSVSAPRSRDYSKLKGILSKAVAKVYHLLL